MEVFGKVTSRRRVIWLYLTLVLTCAANVFLLWKLRSRYRLLAVVALVLAVLALLGGLSIGFLIAPPALLLSTVAVAMQLSESRRDSR